MSKTEKPQASHSGIELGPLTANNIEPLPPPNPNSTTLEIPINIHLLLDHLVSTNPLVEVDS